MKKVLSLCTILCGLSACTGLPLMKSPEATFNAADTTCYDAYKIDKTISTAGAYVSCRRDAILTYARTTGVPRGLVEPYIDKITATARRVDQGKLSAASAEKQYEAAGESFYQYLSTRQDHYDAQQAAYAEAINANLTNTAIQNDSRPTVYRVVQNYAVTAPQASVQSQPQTQKKAIPCQKQLLGTITNPCNAE